jgi:ribosomal protein S18 acetylase RimI-like enzyme
MIQLRKSFFNCQSLIIENPAYHRTFGASFILITVGIKSWDKIDTRELVDFTYQTMKNRNHLHWEGTNLESIKELVVEMKGLDSVCSIARQDDRLVGWMFLFHYTSSMIYIESWQPIVEPSPDEDEIARQLIKESVDYAKRSGRNRLEIFLMRLNDKRRTQYDLYKKWYESAGMPKGNEWAYMVVSLNELDLSATGVPEGFQIKRIADVSNDEIYPCYYDTFASGKDGRFLNQTDEQRRENFDAFFDRSIPFNEKASILLMDGENIAGFSRIIMRGVNGFVNGFGIHPDFRGRGLGKKMLMLSMKLAAENGMPSLILEVEVENLRAYNLYKQVGFRKTHGSISHVWTRQ